MSFVVCCDNHKGRKYVFNAYTVDSGGTDHGVEPKYLQIYDDKFGFRFHRCTKPMVAFQALLGISTHESSLRLYELVNRSQPYRHYLFFSGWL